MEQGQAHRQKAALKLKEIWAIRIRLQLECRTRELALFNLASTASYAVAIWSAFAFTI